MRTTRQILDEAKKYLKSFASSNDDGAFSQRLEEKRFLEEYYLYTVINASENYPEDKLPLDEFKKMQQIVRGVFPYWIDNDGLFSMGRSKLDILSSSGREFNTQDELDGFMMRVKSDYFPPVSIIMPTTARNDDIFLALKSIMEQSYRHFELIIVNDGGDEGLFTLISGMKDQRVKYIRLPENKGAGAARNAGIREASYGLLAFCDDDDAWRKDKLEKQVAALRESEAGFAYCEMEYHRLSGDDMPVITPKRDIPSVRKSGYIYPELLRRNFIGGPTLLIKKQCFDKVGCFNEELMFFEDWEFVLRLAKEYDAVFVPEVLYDYFEHKGSRSDKDADPKSAFKLFYKGFLRDRAAYGLESTDR